MKNHGIRHNGYLLICSVIGALFLWCLATLPAFAVNVVWINGDYPEWSISDNWDGGLVPAPGDNVYIQDGSYVNYDYHYETTAGIASLMIDNFSVLELLPGSQTLTVGLGNPGGGSLIIGDTPETSGTVAQDGGQVYVDATFGALVLGNQSGSEGYYELISGNLTVVGIEEYIGASGSGYFHQYGGTHEFNGAIYIGTGEFGSTASDAYGMYEMLGGTLQSGPGGGGIAIGEWGARGDFIQSGGTVTISDLTLARQVGSTGTYTLNDIYGDSSLTVNGPEIIGKSGNGIFTHEGGTHTAETLVIGSYDFYSPDASTTGTGTYTLNVQVPEDDLPALSVDNLVVGEGGTGTFDHLDGRVNVNSNFMVGQNIDYVGDEDVPMTLNGHGTYNMDNGELRINGSAFIGDSGTGVVNQLGGTLTATNEFIGNNGTGVFNQAGGSNYIGIDPYTLAPVDPGALNELIVARFEGSSGTYNLSNEAVLHAAREIVGDAGFSAPSVGEFHQSGATEHVVHSDLIIGQDPISTGSFTISDISNLTVKGNVFLGDEGGTGDFIQSGNSSVTIEDTLHTSSNSEFGSNPGNGTYEMQSGTLNAANVDNNGTFLFKGGSLNVPGEFVNTGLFQGKGYADTAVFSNSGTVEIGDSPGELSFNGDYIQTSEGVLVIELGGYEPKSGFDFLNIGGSAELGGELRVTLWDGFSPASGSEFDIMNVVNGILNNTIFDQYDLPLGWNWEVRYLDLFNNDGVNETVRLTANSVPVPSTFWLLGTGLIAFVGICRRVDGRINHS